MLFDQFAPSPDALPGQKPACRRGSDGLLGPLAMALLLLVLPQPRGQGRDLDTDRSGRNCQAGEQLLLPGRDRPRGDPGRAGQGCGLPLPAALPRHAVDGGRARLRLPADPGSALLRPACLRAGRRPDAAAAGLVQRRIRGEPRRFRGALPKSSVSVGPRGAALTTPASGTTGGSSPPIRSSAGRCCAKFEENPERDLYRAVAGAPTTPSRGTPTWGSRASSPRRASPSSPST